MVILKKFQDCTDKELKMVLEWRNSFAVRQKMVHQKLISIENHYKFVRSLAQRQDVDYRLVKDKDEYLGVIDLINIRNNQAELGLYKNPTLTGKGIGSLLMKGLYLLAKQNRIKKLLLKVIKSNLRAIGLYKKFDFTVVSEDSNYWYMEKNMKEQTFIVAELSANHNHDFNVAKDSSKAIAETGADAVKIQTYTADTLTIDCNNDFFKINKGTVWDGRTLYDLYKEAYTPWEWHEELRDYAESLDLTFFSTPFDFTAVDFLEKMNNPIYKIASFEVTDIPLIEYAALICKPMIISTGIAELQ